MNEDHQKPESEEPLDNRDAVHEHNREELEKMRAHENQNPNLGRGHNPIHHRKGNV